MSSLFSRAAELSRESADAPYQGTTFSRAEPARACCGISRGRATRGPALSEVEGRGEDSELHNGIAPEARPRLTRHFSGGLADPKNQRARGSAAAERERAELGTMEAAQRWHLFEPSASALGQQMK